MSETTTAALLFSVVGIVFVLIGVPLFQQRVPPNSWYGCRTTKTLSDEQIWYAVNRVTGKDMILTGIVVIISSFVVFVFGRSMNSAHAGIVLLTVLILATAGMAVNSFRVLRRM